MAEQKRYGLVPVALALLLALGPGEAGPGRPAEAADPRPGQESPGREPAEGLETVYGRAEALRESLASLQVEVNESVRRPRSPKQGGAVATVEPRPDDTGWVARCCASHLEAVEAAALALGEAIERLGGAYRTAGHVRGLALVGRLEANGQVLDWRLRELAGAEDAPAAGTAALHVMAALEALSQTVADGDGCCRIPLPGPPPSDDGSGTAG